MGLLVAKMKSESKSAICYRIGFLSHTSYGFP
uniref:Uncharacterized protein n=1 Tax=Phage sp. ctGns7 TaxID=2828003 RepID=A0A8S5S9P0_9VIRU|nr:MAG TPA: hypothetical protein [Phage sp. ctGns7]